MGKGSGEIYVTYDDAINRKLWRMKTCNRWTTGKTYIYRQRRLISVCVIFVVSKVALAQVFLGVLRSTSVNIVPPLPHTQLHFTCYTLTVNQMYEILRTFKQSNALTDIAEHRTLKHIFLMNIIIQIHKVGHTLVQTMDSYNEETEGATEIPCI